MESIATDQCVRVVVRITKPCFEPVIEEVRIIATTAPKISSNWRLEDTQKTNFIGFSQYFLEIGLPKNCVMRFKLMVLHAKDRLVMHMEQFERVLRLRGVPILLEMKYNEPEVQLRELKSWLTTTGAPVNISVHTPSRSTFDPKPRGWDMSEDVEETECHKAEYIAVDGKVACNIRSPPKTAKPDFSTEFSNSKKYCAKHRKQIEANRGGKKAGKDGANENADEEIDKGEQVTGGLDSGGNTCQCNSERGKDEKCASKPEIVVGRSEGLVINQGFQVIYADENGKDVSVFIGNEVIDTKQMDESVKVKDGHVNDTSAHRDDEKSRNQDDIVDVFGRCNSVTISCGFNIETSDETITIPPAIVHDEMPMSLVIHDEKPMQAPVECSQENHTVLLDLNENEMTKETIKTPVAEERYNFVKRCLKYALPVGIVGSLGALGAFLWLRNK